MLRCATEPIQGHWTTDDWRVVAGPIATASDVSRQLGLLDIDDLDDRVLEFLSAAAAELAHAAGIPRRQSSDDPPVVLVRLVAKVAIRHPTASGPHTAKLFEQLP